MKKFLRNLLAATLVIIIASSFCYESNSTNSTSSISTYSKRSGNGHTSID
ncbi:MAG: hypothetical protein IJF37_10600 [Lachnospiraceae bacterium]|nr:hypothetical protein [Lachnospiraceae bacterium]